MTVLNTRTAVREYMSDYSDENINPNSYDLRTYRVLEVMGGITLYADGTRELPPYREAKTYTDPMGREMYRLIPGRLYQVETVESVSLPQGVCAVSMMRSSMHKSGASGEVGLYDTGYEGRCGMTVSVSSTSYVEVGASMFQLIFLESDTDSLYNGMYLDSKWSERLIEG